MVDLDCKDLLKDLQEFLVVTERKLENMVRGFAYEIAIIASDKTPLGNYEAYADLYQMRTTSPTSQSYGLNPEVGFAKGSWQVSFDGQLDLQELYGPSSGTTASKAVRTHMMNYRLGDYFYIGNAGPYIRNLEGGQSIQAPMGIMEPTIAEIGAVYKAKLSHYYAQG